MSSDSISTSDLSEFGIDSILLDSRGCIVQYSPGCENRFDFHNGLIGQKIDGVAGFENVQNQLQTDSSALILGKNGEAFEVKANQTADGQTRLIVTCAPVDSIREESANEMSVLKNRLSAVLDSALDCIIIADHDGRIIEFNAAAEETFGWSAAEVHGKSLAETIIPPEFREAHLKSMRQYQESGKFNILGRRIELEGLCADGSRIPVEFAVNVSRIGDGPPVFTGYLRDITDRIEIQNAQKESEAFLRRTLDSLFSFVGVCKTDGTLTQANKPALDVAGLTEEQVLGQPFWETYWWSHDERVQNQLRRAIELAAKGKTSRYDTEVRIGDGILIPIDFQLVPMRNDDGEIKHLIPSGIDITDRKKAEQLLLDNQQKLIDVLAESEATKAKLQVIFDQSWYFAGAIDLDGNVVEINRTALDRCGYEYSEVIFRPFWETGWWSGSKEVQKTIRNAFERAAKHGEEFRAELPYWLADGTERITDFAMTPARNPIGEIILVVPTGADITDRRNAENREKREAEIDRFLHQASSALSSSLDYDFSLQQITRLCVPTLGDWAFVDLLENHDVTRRVAVAHVNPQDAELANQVATFPAQRETIEHPPAKGLFSGKGVLIPEFTDEMIGASAQNSEHEKVIRAVNPKSIIVVPLVARNTVFGALTLIRSSPNMPYDMNDMRVAEELCRRASIAIDNARLYEEGRQANLAKSEFIANMSHEIRTPMTSVLGYTDLLIDGETDPQQLQFLQTIKRNGSFLLDIINDILDLSKIESGKMDVDPQSLVLKDVVDDVYLMMKGRAQEKGLEFTVNYTANVPRSIQSDEKRLRQILINLLGNAIKFTEQGRIDLTISKIEFESRPQIEFKISDTGIGIQPAHRAHLFEPFSQGDASVTRSYGGSGLGLAISRRLAELLGGDIVLEDHDGEGSVFRCTIDSGNLSTQDDLPESKSNITKPNNGPAEFPKLDVPCNALVVDDRRDVRFLAGHMLKRFGAQVEFCEDGQEAVELIESRMPADTGIDIVFMDMQMPRLSGYEAASQLRKLGFDRPIIALTADAMHGDMTRCLSNGCDAYLSKPIDAGELHQTLIKYIGDDSLN